MLAIKIVTLWFLAYTFPSEAQAQVVKEKFQTHPGEVYENLINSIFANE